MKSFASALFLSFIFTASLVATTAKETKTVKQRLQEHRDLSNVNKEHLVTYLSDRHERRIEKLSELLEERKQQIEHHESGHRKLSSEDHSRILRQRVNFETKLDQLQNRDETEHAEMMSHEAESMYRMESVDYLEF